MMQHETNVGLVDSDYDSESIVSAITLESDLGTGVELRLLRNRTDDLPCHFVRSHYDCRHWPPLILYQV